MRSRIFVGILIMLVPLGVDAAVVEVFEDKGDIFIRAGSDQGLAVGSEVTILGEPIWGTDEHRTLGKATVMEVWRTLARIRLDERASEHPNVRLARLDVRANDTGGAKAAPEAETNGAVFIDPVGLLLFGPVAGAEAAIGPVALGAYARLLSAGLVANVMFPGLDERFTLGYGLGVRGRYFFRPGFSGPYLGLQSEYIRTRIENSFFLIATNSTYVVLTCLGNLGPAEA